MAVRSHPRSHASARGGTNVTAILRFARTLAWLGLESLIAGAIFAAFVLPAGLLASSTFVSPFDRGVVVLDDGTTVSFQSGEELNEIYEQHAGRIRSARMSGGTAFGLVLGAGAALAFVGTAVYSAVRERTSLRPWFQFRWRDVLIGIGGAIAIMLAAGALVSVLPISEDTPGFARNLTSNSNTLLCAAIALIVLIAPVAEELFFRGRLYRGIEARLGWKWALLLTAAVFAAAHTILIPWPVYFIVGLGLAGLRKLSGGLVAPIVAHMTNNLVALLVAFNAPPPGAG